jgi:secreted protein with Ig-like and vWFA domain
VRQTYDAAGDEKSIVFTRDQEATFLAFRDAIEQAIAARHSPVPAAAPAPAPTVLDQIAQLAGLRDAGVLTAEEFDVKKAELLSRL